MIDQHLNILLFIVVSHIFVAIFSVYIGIQIGKSLLYVNNSSNIKYTKENTNLVSNIKIDDAKVVLDIDTKNLTKNFESLGETRVSPDKIASSVNKLKNMKG